MFVFSVELYPVEGPEPEFLRENENILNTLNTVGNVAVTSGLSLSARMAQMCAQAVFPTYAMSCTHGCHEETTTHLLSCVMWKRGNSCVSSLELTSLSSFAIHVGMEDPTGGCDPTWPRSHRLSLVLIRHIFIECAPSEADLVPLGFGAPWLSPSRTCSFLGPMTTATPPRDAARRISVAMRWKSSSPYIPVGRTLTVRNTPEPETEPRVSQQC